MTFVKFLGAFFNGKCVAVYRTDSSYVLRAETTSFRPVRYQYTDDSDKVVWRTVHDLVLTESQYEDFCDRVSADLTPGDVVIVYRALLEMGYPAVVQ